MSNDLTVYHVHQARFSIRPVDAPSLLMYETDGHAQQTREMILCLMSLCSKHKFKNMRKTNMLLIVELRIFFTKGPSRAPLRPRIRRVKEKPGHVRSVFSL